MLRRDRLRSRPCDRPGEADGHVLAAHRSAPPPARSTSSPPPPRRATRLAVRRARAWSAPCLGCRLRPRSPGRPRRRRGNGRRYLDHLVLVGGECPAQVLRRREMLRPALALRQRLVGDVADEVLEEAVLAVLGRARIRLDAEHLLAHEPGLAAARSPLRCLPAPPRASFVNVLPSTDVSWSSRRSSAERPSSLAAMSAWSVSGTSSVVDLARESVCGTVLDERGRGRAASARSRPRTAGCPRRAPGCGHGLPTGGRARDP